ncbi:hypothetical protein [Filimonas effusa]|uniref:Uncharacterized protein n=1 Tax=Filimonas effusa TaxID=2508721 RepID=A0A4V1MAT6_9BACT|nr:hypothetical protein [Filimonas effusa]RXK87006.1 hypothetical protein ESB13_09550 [Filimonas effusa]
MRKIKFLFPMAIAILILTVALVTSAFTAKTEVKAKAKFAPAYFVLISESSENSASARTDPNSWMLANGTGSDISCPDDVTHICKIYAENNAGKPVISGTLYTILNNGESTDVPVADGVNLWTRQ